MKSDQKNIKPKSDHKKNGPINRSKKSQAISSGDPDSHGGSREGNAGHTTDAESSQGNR